MTYDDIVRSVRKTFENADARRVLERIVFEIDIVGEVEGKMYFELINRECVIEPYECPVNDGVITASAEVLMQLADIDVHLEDAIKSGLVSFKGDERKMRLCIENIRLPGVDYD